MTTSRTPRAAARAQMEQDVLRVAREHLVVTGAAALSLRAIARDLGVVSSAVYRYVRSRDDLLTLLLVDAYTDLADAVAAIAQEHEPGDGDTDDTSADARELVRAVAAAVRAWAVAEPARWALLYGSPVPGYAAPTDQTTGPGTRVIALILRATAGLSPRADVVAGVAATMSADAGTAGAARFDTVRAEFAVDTDDIGLLAATVLYATIIGAVSLEVFGQYGPDLVTDPATFLDAQIHMLLAGLYGDP